MTKNAVKTRNRILDSAGSLFNTAGIRGATLDAIAAAAGVTKKTLYYHFRSKDDLVAASLAKEDMSGPGERRISTPDLGSFQENVLSLFADIARFAADPHWQGCAFTRAAFELAGMPGHPGVAAAKGYKGRLENKFFQELEIIGLGEARTVSRRLILLLDGAITHCVVFHDPEYAFEAGRLALELVSAAMAKAHIGLNPASVSMPKPWKERTTLERRPNLQLAS